VEPLLVILDFISRHIQFCAFDSSQKLSIFLSLEGQKLFEASQPQLPSNQAV
jgi:hypothetical protein